MKRKLDESKILLVIVCKDKAEADQQIKVVTKSNLEIPQECTMELQVVIGRKNFARSFNDIQKEDNSKYKFYLMSPAIFLQKKLVIKTIEAFFLEPKTGLVGLMGSEVPVDGDYTKAKSFYGLYTYKDENDEIQNYVGKDPLYYQSVHMVDNNFFATNEDFVWDEKVGDDFFVAAQCLNFRAKGYDVGVVYQEKPYIIFEKDTFNYNTKPDIQSYNEQLEKFNLFYRKKFQPLVSVLIPTYNQPKFCQSALESALNQTYQNIEILVGDDSTDEDTKKMIKPFLKKNPNLKYFYHDGKIPRGGGANMAFLLNKCSGDYVNYLLHDDLFHPEKIKKMMDYFVADLENEIGLITSARSRIDENGNFIRRQNPWQPHSDVMLKGEEVGRRILFIIANFIGELTTVLFKKKDVALKNPAPGANRFAIGNFCGVYSRSYGDLDTWLEILKSSGNLIFMSESLSAFRQHAAQNTYNPNTRITLPLDALNFITLAWINNVFFRDVNEFNYCLEKWPILANRWFNPIAEDDPEVIKKRKECISKLLEVFATRDYTKMTDAAISYLLECVPKYGLNDHLIRKNSNGLWEKNTTVPVEIKNFDEIDNRWIMYGNPLIVRKNAKFNKALQISCGNYVVAEEVVFGGADFTIDFWGFMDASCPTYGVFFAAQHLNSQGLIYFNRHHETDNLLINVLDYNGKTIFEELQIISDADSIDKMHHYEIAYNHSEQSLKVFVDGELKIEKDSVNIEKLVRKVWLGNCCVNQVHFPFSGAISEFRISNCIRHDSNFTPPTKKYEVDENTLSLLHFD